MSKKLTQKEVDQAYRYFDVVYGKGANMFVCSLLRTSRHETLCDMFDCDRDLIANAIEDCQGDIDAFYDALSEIKDLPKSKRHPVIVLTENDIETLSSINIPSLKS